MAGRPRTRLDELRARDLFDLVDGVCHRRGILLHEILGRVRTRGVVHARQEIWWLLRHDPERSFSLVEIGRLFGRDHSTVLAGVAAHSRRSAAPPTCCR